MNEQDFFLGGFVCGPRRKLPKCQFCHTRDGENQCDYPTGGPCPKCRGLGARTPKEREKLFEQSFKRIIEGGESIISVAKAKEGLEALHRSYQCHDCAGNGKAQCNRFFCGRTCGVRISEEEGYCPDHLERAGHTKPLIKEPCWWLEECKYEGECLRRSCGTIVEAGTKALYFPNRKRVMCSDCGTEYLRIAIEVK